MKKMMVGLLLLCLLTGGIAIAEDNSFTPDGLGLLMFGMSRDEAIEAVTSTAAERAGIYPSLSSVMTLRFTGKAFLNRTLYCKFEDEKIAYAYRNLNGTVGRDGVFESNGDYEENVFPALTAKYGEGNIARFTEDKYLAISDLLADAYGEPMFSGEQATFAAPCEYSDPLYGLTGETDIIIGSGSEGAYSYKALRYEQWVLPMPNGSSMLVHHLEYVKTYYLYDEYTKEAEAITEDWFDSNRTPKTVHILQYLPYTAQ